ncbi:UNVERIFIED_CONTAM: hypothetical protein Sradi_5290900 [Sesamum radiatum]|uniref:Uncharacterized protein n=1 Tax=Sesamum radiatum TaxID=300843 RepID=A0AAW2LMC0_SESRA
MEETFFSKFTTVSHNWEFSSSGIAAHLLGDAARLGLSGYWPTIFATSLLDRVITPRLGPIKTRDSDTTSQGERGTVRLAVRSKRQLLPNSNTRLSTLAQHADRIGTPNATTESNSKQGAVECSKSNTSFRTGFLLNRK